MKQKLKISEILSKIFKNNTVDYLPEVILRTISIEKSLKVS